jgi:hypothetical protein
VEERLRRGTYTPPRLPLCEGLDPLQAHRHRLERLRDLALAEGLVSTAVSAHRAIGRVLGYDGAKRGKARPAPVAEKPATPPPPKPLDIMPFIRGMIDADPDAGRIMLDVIAEIRAEEAAARPPAEISLAAAM